jgi:hypothetical protein
LSSTAFEIIEIGLLLFVGVLAASTLIVRKRPPAAPAPARPPSERTWTESGLRDLQGDGFNLVSVTPTASHNVAEFAIKDARGLERGSIVFWNQARATIAWHGRQYVRYSQQLEGEPTEYAGKVRGTSDRSIVVHDDAGRVVSEIEPLREGLAFTYTIACNGAAYAVAAPSETAPFDRALHTVLKFGETVAAYQANNVGGLSEFVALHEDLPDGVCVAVLVCSLLR